MRFSLVLLTLTVFPAEAVTVEQQFSVNALKNCTVAAAIIAGEFNAKGAGVIEPDGVEIMIARRLQEGATNVARPGTPIASTFLRILSLSEISPCIYVPNAEVLAIAERVERMGGELRILEGDNRGVVMIMQGGKPVFVVGQEISPHLFRHEVRHLDHYFEIYEGLEARNKGNPKNADLAVHLMSTSRGILKAEFLAVAKDTEVRSNEIDLLTNPNRREELTHLLLNKQTARWYKTLESVTKDPSEAKALVDNITLFKVAYPYLESLYTLMAVAITVPRRADEFRAAFNKFDQKQYLRAIEERKRDLVRAMVLNIRAVRIELYKLEMDQAAAATAAKKVTLAKLHEQYADEIKTTDPKEAIEDFKLGRPNYKVPSIHSEVDELRALYDEVMTDFAVNGGLPPFP